MDIQDDIFGVLDKIRNGGQIVVRDDQHEFSDILDAVKTARWRKARFNFVDTGRFGVSELEWLSDAGAHLYTSDEARPSVAELQLIRKAGLRGQAVTALWQRGPVENRKLPGRLSFSDLKELAGAGIIIHLSNRERDHDFSTLAELAEETFRSGGFLIYYHHGRPVSELEELAVRGVRIHLSDRHVRDEDIERLGALLEASRAKASKLVLYIEKGMPALSLRMLKDRGAVLLFKTPPAEPRSLIGILERKARRNPPEPDSYYLNTAFLI